MRLPLAVLFAALTLTASAQTLTLPNSGFLIEEAWRGDSVVGQHVLAFAGDEWSYSWTHEWASADSPHRFAYSVPLSTGSEPGVNRRARHKKLA